MNEKSSVLDRFTHPDYERIFDRGTVTNEQQLHAESIVQPESATDKLHAAASEFHASASAATNSESGDPAALDAGSLYVAPGDLVVACDRCGSAVATERETYDSARRDSAEVVCPSCAEKAAASGAASRRTASTYGGSDSPDVVSVVVVDSPPTVVFIDDSPAVYVGSDVVDSFDSSGGDFGGGGASGDY